MIRANSSSRICWKTGARSPSGERIASACTRPRGNDRCPDRLHRDGLPYIRLMAHYLFADTQLATESQQMWAGHAWLEEIGLESVRREDEVASIVINFPTIFNVAEFPGGYFVSHVISVSYAFDTQPFLRCCLPPSICPQIRHPFAASFAPFASCTSAVPANAAVPADAAVPAHGAWRIHASDGGTFR